MENRKKRSSKKERGGERRGRLIERGKEGE